MRYFVRSSDGCDYRIGYWHDGFWIWGGLDRAKRELAGLNEPGAYVWGRSW